jgi:hypothetical protein
MKLIGYFGGQAHTGACYEIEHRSDGKNHHVEAFTSGGSPRKGMGVIYQGDNAVDARKKLLSQAYKKYTGRERAYSRGLPGTQYAGEVSPGFPNKVDAVGEYQQHPLLWSLGQSSMLLPAGLRREVGDTGTSLPTPITVAPSVATDSRAWNVMLCKTVNDPARYIADDNYIAMRKVEGRRATVEHNPDGTVQMYNRSGQRVTCPDHIAQAMRELPFGTHLDGELVVMNADGRESLYGGMDDGSLANNSVFVMFDLMELAGTQLLRARQSERLHLLGGCLTLLPEGSPIRCVERAGSTFGKQRLLALAQQRGWEGLIFRHVDMEYTQGRDWLRYKMRRQTIDAVVVGYHTGTGSNAQRVGAVDVALYQGDQLVGVGEVGGGWEDSERNELQRRREAGITGYVVTLTAEGLSAGKKLIRPSAVCIRPDGDKRANECTFSQVRGQ